ncbi:hypothetical protein BASA50_007437 [Batrachochytrium salamandrivorans]|uniref:Small GTP-binding protein domain n=1 Tax=Batrachochytrium salamandrivorans TaxID=1357716 RepID=A0ABQ8F6Q9_9FUNG|nr:hypothetical protein BASA62_008976 [Batrachochytrium salamandrivorans]KAH6593230.1 hypothetical protein BASA50_007437 [Batrachochytrium salamandrivorans]KAH9247400.1 hypothetical protein BASA81_014994 [Batrachochytrium salamandrivorans]KAH9274133.1 hypothetical protein BASA83_003435 [Batrachochytrium salamandrivorans]KAJ1343053.1 hypothetical protein BSLG_002079 [Batrachochytrium salamandrivorans]
MLTSRGFTQGSKRVIVIGSAGCGKSALIQRYINNTFQTEYRQTFGADLYVKNTNEHKKYSMQIWCCGGHERYRTLLDQFYVDINVALVCFDLQNPDSFKEVEFWYNELKRAAPDALVTLVGTKAEDMDNTAVKIQDAMKVAKDWNMDFKAVSSKTGLNIEELFSQVVSKFD